MQSVALVRVAMDLGVNLLDTAAAYGTENIVGEAIKPVPRESVVVATKAQYRKGGADSVIDAAYRYARHEPGTDVILFGTGDLDHLRTNLASPLPPADVERLDELFGRLEGIGLDLPVKRDGKENPRRMDLVAAFFDA